jgi:DNA-directed RNA polymerase subunit delta
LSLAQYTKEQLEEMSLIDMAYAILEKNNDKQTIAFTEIMDQIIAATGLKETEVRARIAQFYTDMNVDGRFLCMGDNHWGLRSWYPVEQAEEDTITQIKPKKKKAKKLKDDDYDDDEDHDYDDLDEFEEEDLLEEDDLLDDLDEDDDADDFEDEEIPELDELEVEDDELVEEELELDEEDDEL